ncbi:MAG TPA: NAD-dependent epimerase/dehydratase family protein [Acidimicrobiia bacterium]|jgi:UDP-glucose 4-epimerase|nr:NAD-dependent epimerase/dehydratase family protein [Acidimicrobiia bacterium]
MRVLVTGGAGFIGSTLVERLLAEDCEVDVVDDLSSGSLPNLAEARARRVPRCTFQRLDVREKGIVELMTHRKPEVVFHLAAQASVTVSVADPTFDADVNVLGSLNVLQGALAAGCRKVVFAGSGGTLYGVPGKIPTTEGHAQHPISPYGVSKKAVGDYLHYYRAVHDLEYTVLALANVYGPRQDPHGEAGVVAIFANTLLSGQRPPIFGDGKQTRDFVFVDDVADAFARAAHKGGGLIVNIGTGVETSVHELYDLMAGAVGFEQPARSEPPRAGELRRSALDPGRAAIQLGWQPWTPLRDGVAATIAWFREARSAG